MKELTAAQRQYRHNDDDGSGCDFVLAYDQVVVDKIVASLLAEKRQGDWAITTVENSHNLLVQLLAEVGVGTGERGYIQHDHMGEFIKDDLSLDGELIFGFDAIKEIIGSLERENAHKDEKIAKLRLDRASLLELLKEK